MAEQSDWDAAYRDLIARGRARVGEPPSPETLVAYSLGQLSESEAERVREALAYYPDLAAALSEPEEPANAHEPYMTQAQLADDWHSLQQRINARPTTAELPTVPKRQRFWYLATAASLLMAVLFAGLYLKARRDLHDPNANVERIDLF